MLLQISTNKATHRFLYNVMRGYKGKLFNVLVFFVITTSLFAQAHLTKDGNYACVIIDKGYERPDPTLVLQSTRTTWKREISGVSNFQFVYNDKKVLFSKKKFTYFLTLGKDELDSCETSFGSHYNGKTGSWFVYHEKEANPILYVRDISQNNTIDFRNVINYKVNPDAGVMVVIRVLKSEQSVIHTTLELINLMDGSKYPIWTGTELIKTFEIAKSGRKVAFITTSSSIKEKADYSKLFLYDRLYGTTKLMIDDNASFSSNHLFISNLKLFERNQKSLLFSKDETTLFFSLRESYSSSRESSKRNPSIDIWSYFDVRFQNQQVGQDTGVVRSYRSAIKIASRKIIRLEMPNEVLNTDELSSKANNEYVILTHFDKDIFNYRKSNRESYIDYTQIYYAMYEYGWNNSFKSDVYLVSLKDGKRKLVKGDIRPYSAALPMFELSPSGKYVLYFDQPSFQYFSYNILNGSHICLTKKIRTLWCQGNGISADIANYYKGIPIQWFSKGDTAILSDQYSDCWKVDVTGIVQPEYMTLGLARKKDLQLRFLYQDTSVSKYLFSALPDRQHGCFTNTMGIFQITKIAQKNDLKILLPINSGYAYRVLSVNGGMFLIERENDKEPISYFYTKDFVVMHPITSSKIDERLAHGILKEILHWKSYNGIDCFGILFKPMDFDSTKRYPVIVSFYEELKNSAFYRFHVFDQKGKFNIRHNGVDGISLSTVDDEGGYLLFVPEIRLRNIGYTGDEVFDIVESGARYLARRQYVNASKMGITGFSYGGLETNFIIARSRLFTAAFTRYGYSDMFSTYWGDHLPTNERHGEGANEVGQNRLGVSPNDRPDLYLQNSAVFYADKVSMPVLIAHNKDDGNVAYYQSVELFKALRRAGKKVWLLSGDEGGHRWESKYEKQFFDYYLKDSAAPKWMTRGIPARLKGIDSGFEMDLENKSPPKPTIYKERAMTPAQAELLKHKTTVNINGRIVDVKDNKKVRKK